MSNEENEIPRGPEDVPLQKYINKLNLVIVIVDIKSNRKIREEHINYSDKEARMWLGRITVWAANNNYAVTTCNEADYVVDE